MFALNSPPPLLTLPGHLVVFFLTRLSLSSQQDVSWKACLLPFGRWSISVKISRISACSTTVCQEQSASAKKLPTKIIIMLFAGMSPQQSPLAAFFVFTLQLLPPRCQPAESKEIKQWRQQSSLKGRPLEGAVLLWYPCLLTSPAPSLTNGPSVCLGVLWFCFIHTFIQRPVGFSPSRLELHAGKTSRYFKDSSRVYDDFFTSCNDLKLLLPGR